MARLVLTDSAGIQEETSFLGVHCLAFPKNTERPATITHGANQLVGTCDGSATVGGIIGAQDRNGPRSLYGGGRSAPRLVEILKHWWSAHRLRPSPRWTNIPQNEYESQYAQ